VNFLTAIVEKLRRLRAGMGTPAPEAGPCAQGPGAASVAPTRLLTVIVLPSHEAISATAKELRSRPASPVIDPNALPAGWVRLNESEYAGKFRTKNGRYNGAIRIIGKSYYPRIEKAPTAVTKHREHGGCFTACADQRGWREIHLKGHRPKNIQECILGVNEILQRLGG